MPLHTHRRPRSSDPISGNTGYDLPPFRARGAQAERTKADLPRKTGFALASILSPQDELPGHLAQLSPFLPPFPTDTELCTSQVLSQLSSAKHFDTYGEHSRAHPVASFGGTSSFDSRASFAFPEQDPTPFRTDPPPLPPTLPPISRLSPILHSPTPSLSLPPIATTDPSPLFQPSLSGSLSTPLTFPLLPPRSAPLTASLSLPSVLTQPALQFMCPSSPGSDPRDDVAQSHAQTFTRSQGQDTADSTEHYSTISTHSSGDTQQKSLPSQQSTSFKTLSWKNETESVCRRFSPYTQPKKRVLSFSKKMKQQGYTKSWKIPSPKHDS